MIASLFATLYVAIGIGLATSIIPGPILILTIAEALRSGYRAGLAVVVAPVVVDALVMIPLALLLSNFLTTKVARVAIGLIGGAILVYLGIRTLQQAFRKRFFLPEIEQATPERPESAWVSFRRGFVTHLFSPFAYVFWATVGAFSLRQALDSSGWAGAVVFPVGFWLGSAIVGVASALLSGKGRDILDTRQYQVVLTVCGFLLIALAFVVAVRAAVS